jgi:hypothetical protein
MSEILSSNHDVSRWLAGFEARLSLLESNMIARANNVDNKVLSLQSAIQAATVTINALESMFRETEPVEVGSCPTSVKRDISDRNQMIAGARQQLDWVRVKLQSMLGDLDFGCRVAAEDVLKAVQLVNETDNFLRHKSRSPSP